jgi:hypothetical protein
VYKFSVANLLLRSPLLDLLFRSKSIHNAATTITSNLYSDVLPFSIREVALETNILARKFSVRPPGQCAGNVEIFQETFQQNIEFFFMFKYLGSVDVSVAAATCCHEN